MVFLTRCLDWLCLAYASGAQDEVRLNQLMLVTTRRSDPVATAVAKAVPRR